MAASGKFDVLVDRIRACEADRVCLRDELALLDVSAQMSTFDVGRIEKSLRARIDDWRALLHRGCRSRREFGDALRRLPRRRRRALIATIETDGDTIEPSSGSYPEHSGCRVVVTKPGEKAAFGTYTALEPYGIDASSPAKRKATVPRLDSDTREPD